MGAVVPSSHFPPRSMESGFSFQDSPRAAHTAPAVLCGVDWAPAARRWPLGGPSRPSYTPAALLIGTSLLAALEGWLKAAGGGGRVLFGVPTSLHGVLLQ